MKLILKIILILFVFISFQSRAEIVSQQQIADAVRNSPHGTQWLRDHANDIGSLAVRVESTASGKPGYSNTHAQNGCCTGVLQVNGSNLRSYGETKDGYKYSSLQHQVDIWMRLTGSSLSHPNVRKLSNMQTFDGRTVDFSLILACIQLGPGNCGKMLRSGNCSGFADSNGTTICKMADKLAGKKGGTGQAVGDILPGDSGGSDDMYTGTVETYQDNRKLSLEERIDSVANFRFQSDSWAKSITSASSRSLYADHLSAKGTELYLKNEIQKKRNHIEALFATLASQKIKEAKKNAIYAFNNSQSTNISNAIK